MPPMMLGAILNPINSSIISIALVPIAVALGVTAADAAWLVSALYLATAIGQPLVGRLVDLYGPKRLFLAGAGLTALAGIIGVLAPNLPVLVAARIVLGFGTCAGYPSAMAIIRRVAERGGLRSPAGVLAALAVATQTVSVIGPTLGGLLIEWGGWRATFAVNVPLGLLSLALGWWLVPSLRQGQGATEEPVQPRRLDAPGVALFASALTSLLVFLMDPSAGKLWALGVALAGGAAFVWWERRAADPFIDVRLLAGNRPLLATYLRALGAQTVAYAFIYGFSQWLEDGRGLAPSAAGLVLLPVFGVGILGTILFGRTPRVRANLLAGASVQLAASAALWLFDANTPIWLLFALACPLGIPQGLLSLANQNALYAQARPDAIGASAGLLRTFQYVGAIIASASAGLCFGERATTPGLHELAVVMVAVSVCTLTLILADRSLARVGQLSSASGRTNQPQ
jgi:MFS family permease